ncbi:sugar transferase [Erysipelotrichaceae bacterium 7770_A6]|jgi:lipopolysaccharide/colanic/teichoic acid biosynthesis glycosyltransferase|nr:sugar transferase [Erysipelotrichaceae bacterium 7770_A6]
MILRSWDKLPEYMRNDKVKPYYELLKKRTGSLIMKRIFDIVMSLLLLMILSPVFLVVSIWIKLDSKGPVFFRQVRVTTYGKQFRIFKFRTMCENAEKKGSLVTVGNDSRITKVGEKIRHCRLDEIPQLLNVLAGDMTFVGTRPEVVKYVNAYSDEMYATLLLPAGITSVASIQYKDEDEILSKAKDPDDAYIHEVLPDKMKYNLASIENFSFLNEIKTMVNTLKAVI